MAPDRIILAAICCAAAAATDAFIAGFIFVDIPAAVADGLLYIGPLLLTIDGMGGRFGIEEEGFEFGIVELVED